MTDWREHDGGPQPVADDVWVGIVTPPCLNWWDIETMPAKEAGWGQKFEWSILNDHLIDAKQAEIDALQHEVMWLHNALEQTEEAVVYGYTLLDDMDAKIDAARLEGIRLGLDAAVVLYADKCRASGRFKVAMSFVTHAEDILALNSDTIAKEAQHD